MIGSRKGWIDTPEDCGGQIFPATMTLLLRMVARANGSGEDRYARGRYREVFPVNHPSVETTRGNNLGVGGY